MALTRADILKHRPSTTIEVEAFGGVVKLKAMTSSERDLFEQRYAKIKNAEEGVTPNIRAFFLVHHIVGDDNKPLFGVKDVSALGEQPADEMDKLFSVCQSLSGFSDSDEEQLKKK